MSALRQAVTLASTVSDAVSELDELVSNLFGLADEDTDDLLRAVVLIGVGAIFIRRGIKRLTR